MERNTHYYVSRKHPLTWLMVLCMISSVVARFLIVGVKGPSLWSQIVLPVTACLLYVLIILISGKEYFYKSAIPVWLMGLYYVFVFESIDFHMVDTLITMLYAVALLFIVLYYTHVTAGKAKGTLLLILVMLVPLAALLYIYRMAILTQHFADLMPLLPDTLMTAGVLFTLLSVDVHPVDEYHPTWGDRIDGRRVRTEPPMNQFTPYVMQTRAGSCNYFSDALEITAAERYIRQRRKEGLTGLGLTHLLLACYCRTLAKYPSLNRFISGQKIYTRDQDIQFCMIIKKDMSTDSPETLVKLHLSPRDTIDDIYHKLNDEVEKLKNSPLDSDFDHTAQALMMIPGLMLRFTVGVLKFLDYFGLLPKVLLEVSPFHGSVFFTSMGSLGIPPVFHHLYDFGNMPAFGSFGCKRRAMEMLDDGSIIQKKYMDVNFTIDERIVDGFYCATFFKHFKRLFRHPEQLELPPEEVKRDID